MSLNSGLEAVELEMPVYVSVLVEPMQDSIEDFSSLATGVATTQRTGHFIVYWSKWILTGHTEMLTGLVVQPWLQTP